MEPLAYQRDDHERRMARIAMDPDLIHDFALIQAITGKSEVEVAELVMHVRRESTPTLFMARADTRPSQPT